MLSMASTTTRWRLVYNAVFSRDVLEFRAELQNQQVFRKPAKLDTGQFQLPKFS
jgi:hypothetical protein